MTEQDLHDYNKWLTEVWSKQHSNIPFMKDAPNAYLKYRAKQLTLPDVGNCPFEAYAVFCIECDRKGIKPIKHKDYLNLG